MRSVIWLLKDRQTNTLMRENCPVAGGMHTKQFATKEDAEAWLIGLVIEGTASFQDWLPIQEPGKLRPPC